MPDWFLAAKGHAGCMVEFETFSIGAKSNIQFVLVRWSRTLA